MPSELPESAAQLILYVSSKCVALVHDVLPEGGPVLPVKVKSVDDQKYGSHGSQKQQVSHLGSLLQLRRDRRKGRIEFDSDTLDGRNDSDRDASGDQAIFNGRSR